MHTQRIIVIALPLFAMQAIAGCASTPKGETAAETSRAQENDLEVSLAHGTPAEEATRTQLHRLLASHDLRPWVFTHKVIIDEEAIPHSHPVLTLHTRHLGEDDQLLSTFIHEEIHWFLDSRAARTERAVAELRSNFPRIPVGYPDGAQSEQSSYEHLLVIFLEREGLTGAVGEPRTSEVFRFWEEDHYRALYKIVRQNRDALARVLIRNELVPAFLHVEPSLRSGSTLQ